MFTGTGAGIPAQQILFNPDPATIPDNRPFDKPA